MIQIHRTDIVSVVSPTIRLECREILVFIRYYPGSPRISCESIDVILPLLDQILDVRLGQTPLIAVRDKIGCLDESIVGLGICCSIVRGSETHTP